MAKVYVLAWEIAVNSNRVIWRQLERSGTR